MNYKEGPLIKKDQNKIPSLLVSSLKMGVSDVLEFFIKTGSDPMQIKLEEGNTLLHVSTSSYNFKAIQILLSHGADPNAQNNFLKTPLHTILHSWPSDNYPMKMKLEIMKELLEKGADSFIADKDGIFSFQYAIFSSPYARNRDRSNQIDSYLNILKLLFPDKEKINRQTPEGFTVLHYIFKEMEGPLTWENRDFTLRGIEYLLEQDADLTIASNNGKTPSDYLKNLPRAIGCYPEANK